MTLTAKIKRKINSHVKYIDSFYIVPNFFTLPNNTYGRLTSKGVKTYSEETMNIAIKEHLDIVTKQILNLSK